MLIGQHNRTGKNIATVPPSQLTCAGNVRISGDLMVKRILGISAFYHDSAAALLVDGDIAAAAQEERFTRVKHDPTFPEQSIRYCLSMAGGSVDQVVFYEKPFRKFDRLLHTYAHHAPRGFRSFREAMGVWLGGKLLQKREIRKGLRAIDPRLDNAKLLFAEHHQSHAAAAFYPSPFDRAAVLTLDGVGEWATTSVAMGDGSRLEMQKEINFPHSLGLLYSAFTAHAGFKVNSGEYKLMGLAPFGTPRFRDLIYDNLIDLKADGSFQLNLDFFDYPVGFSMTNARFDALFEGPPRDPDVPISQRDCDLAASIQSVTEEVVLRMVAGLSKESGTRNLCLAGGVALNCVANGKLARSGLFDEIWVQPAAGDAGGALGAAYCAHYLSKNSARRNVGAGDAMRGARLGPAFEQDEIEARLTALGAVFSTLGRDALIAQAAALLSDGESALGWFQGRMEFGPRALGARSILADPRSPNMQRKLNLKIKYRESFRPFAPAIMLEHAGRYFDQQGESPYMLQVSSIVEKRRLVPDNADEGTNGAIRLGAPRSDIPAVTHIDYSARVQTVSETTHPDFHALLAAFHERTGCPVLVNTSFNVRGEPIVATPEDAFRCFMGTEMDVLAIGNCLLLKRDQNPAFATNYDRAFAPD